MNNEMNKRAQPTTVQHNIMHYVVLSLTSLVLLFGCQTSEPSPTPTPTRTPILPTATPTLSPTPTPTATATPTLTPTPTLPPGLKLPTTPVAPDPDTLPPLPTDLYFLRDGQLWVWLAEGGQFQSIPTANDGTHNILDYRITADKRYIAYVTDNDELYLFDRAQWQHMHIPTSGRLINENKVYFDVTSDSLKLIYAAWGVQLSTGDSHPTNTQDFATFLMIDLENPLQIQNSLGICVSTEDKICQGFDLSAEGEQIIYTDGRGIWLRNLSEPEPRLLLSYEEHTPWEPLSLSADHQWLLLKSSPGNTPTFALLSLESADIFVVPNSGCPNCRIEASWGTEGLWLSKDNELEGCLQKLSPNEADPSLQPTYQLCQAGEWALHPTSPYTLPDGWVAFIHRGCGTDCPGPAPGIYFLAPDEQMHPIALMPEVQGTLLWGAEGAAFIYFDQNNAPKYIGTTDTNGFWDVHLKLQNAHTFQWDQPTSLLP